MAMENIFVPLLIPSRIILKRKNFRIFFGHLSSIPILILNAQVRMAISIPAGMKIAFPALNYEKMKQSIVLVIS
ncbi:hypothetical protein [Methanofollis ethanolicus]|uniref:hypothetical protein n=1 Tax=Methanofollis ethanolicus TaxID=488124 RepID=UPI00082BE826|nr:hypothetical protein [Methanofollis ethanolicus]